MDEASLKEQFISITGAPAHIATHVLEAHGYEMDAAVGFYFESGGVGHGSVYEVEQTPFGPGQVTHSNPSHFTEALTQPSPTRARSPPIELMDDDDDDVQLVSAKEGIPEVTIDDDDDDEMPSERRVRRNRPRGASVIDSELEELQRRFGGPDDDIELPLTRQQAQMQQRQPQPGLDEADLPPDVDLEEQRMLMAAMTGHAYEGRIPDFNSDPRYRGQRDMSPETQERELLRQEQDAAYYQSLAEDQEKEAATRRAQQELEEAERRKQEEQRQLAMKEQAEKETYEAEIRRKEASLPPEPSLDEDEGIVGVVIRLPWGGRVTRRFRQSDTLQAIFDFLDVQARDSELKPNSYNLVCQFPRRVFEDGGNMRTLADAELVHKQEALFIELK